MPTLKPEVTVRKFFTTLVEECTSLAFYHRLYISSIYIIVSKLIFLLILFQLFSKKALQHHPSVTQGKGASVFDLSKEIAFNVSLIYRSVEFSSTGADVARMYLDKYVTI